MFTPGKGLFSGGTAMLSHKADPTSTGACPLFGWHAQRLSLIQVVTLHGDLAMPSHHMVHRFGDQKGAFVLSLSFRGELWDTLVRYPVSKLEGTLYS